MEGGDPITSQLGVHHETVERVLAQQELSPEHSSNRTTLISPYMQFVVAKLEQYPRPCASRLFQMAKERGYPGGPDHFVSRWSEVATQPWIEKLLDIEEVERRRRSLARRLRNARRGSFKAIDRFDWKWPSNIDRQAIEELFSLAFIDECENAIFLGLNGVEAQAKARKAKADQPKRT